MNNPAALLEKPYSDQVWKQLLNDAPFAWFLRNEGATSPTHRLSDIQEMDQTLSAYIDALLIGQNGGYSLADDLNMNDVGAVFIAATVGFVLDDEALIKAAFQTVIDDEEDERSEELFQAVRWQNLSKDRLQQIYQFEHSEVRQAVYGACLNGSNTRYLEGDLNDAAPLVTQRLLYCIGQLRRTDLKSYVSAQYHHEDEGVRFEAGRAGIFLGDPVAIELVESFAREGQPRLREALELIFRFGAQSDTALWLERIQSMGFSGRIKALSMGYAGSVAYMPELIAMMEDINIAQVAGEAFSLLTGVDISGDNLDEAAPDGDEPSAAEKRQMDDQYRDYEEDLPWPDPEKVQAWWQAHQSEYSAGVRYLCGLTLTEQNLETVLQKGTQSQRFSAALSLGQLRMGTDITDVTDQCPCWPIPS